MWTDIGISPTRSEQRSWSPSATGITACAISRSATPTASVSASPASSETGSSDDDDEEDDKADERQHCSLVRFGLLLDEAFVREGDVRSRGHDPHARPACVREQRGGEVAETAERERDRDKTQGRAVAAVSQQEAGASDDDAGGGYEWRRPGVHRRR